MTNPTRRFVLAIGISLGCAAASHAMVEVDHPASIGAAIVIGSAHLACIGLTAIGVTSVQGRPWLAKLGALAAASGALCSMALSFWVWTVA